LPALDFNPILFRYLICAFATGYACRTALAWVSRPSQETAVLQSGLNRTRLLTTLAVCLAAVALLAGYPAVVLLPASAYLLLRVFWTWQLALGPGVVTRLQLFLIARAGEIVALATLWFLRGKPLS
jgi:hypothetical protein